MASTAVTVQDMFSAGLPAIRETANKAMIKPHRQLPMRDEQGKFVERNTGLLLGALNKIHSTLNVLVGLTKQSLSIDKGEQITDQREARDLSLKGAEADPKEIKEEGQGFIGKGWDKLKGALSTARQSPSIMLGILLGGLALLSRYSEQLVGPLSDVLEWFDKNGMPGIEKLALKIKTKIKAKWDKFMENVDKFHAYWFTEEGGGYQFIEKVQGWFFYWTNEEGEGYKKIQLLINFFTVQDEKNKDDESITSFEKQIEDWKTTLTDWRTYLKAIPGILFMGLFFKRAFPMGVPLKSGRGMPGGRISKFIKGGTAFGLVGMILYGLYSLRESVEDGSETFKEELIKDGKAAGNFNWSALRKGISDAITVDDDSGFTGAFRNVLPMGGTAVGIVATLGLPLLAIPGAYPAALFAAAMIGGTVGIITGALGEEKVDEYLAMLDPTADGWAKDMFGWESPLIKSVRFIWSAYELLILKPWEEILKGIAKATDSELFQNFLNLDLDPNSWLKRMGYTTTKPENLSKVDLYGENVDPDQVALKSTSELLKIKEEMLAKKADLPQTQTIFGKHFFGEHLDSHAKRQVYETLETVTAELKSRHVSDSSEEASLKDLVDIWNKDLSFKNAEFVFDEAMMLKYKELGTLFKTNPSGTGFILNNPVDSSTEINAVGGDSVYTGSLGVVDTNGTAASLGNANSLEVTVPLAYSR